MREEANLPRDEERLHDPYGRTVNNLRISVTQKCNFSCFFCHREGETTQPGAPGELSPEEIGEVVRVAYKFGIDKVKLTGGEPLLRPDIFEIVSMVAPYTRDLSITTNGSLLERYAGRLHDLGVNRVNISLHSIKPKIFEKITGCDMVREVERGVDAAVENGFEPVKLNMVVLSGINTDEIPRMVEFARDRGAILQLIEFQPIQVGTEAYWKQYHHDLDGVEKALKKDATRIIERQLHRRRQYFLRGGGVVEVVKPMHNSQFCWNCTRLRLTSDGKLKPCLMRNDNLVDILPILRRESSETTLEDAFREAVSRREPFWRECV